MSLRPAAEARLVATFAATVLALVVVAWLVVTSTEAWLAHDEALRDELARERVLARLSTTTDDAARAQLTSRVDALLAPIVGAHATVRRDAEGVRSLAAVFAALVVVVVALAVAVWRGMASEQRRLASELAHECTHDALTALPNARFFSEWLAFAIANARREGAHVGVLFIDIGGCAAVAEHHGGPAAEALLVEIARRFRASARQGDVLARLGASEFALATPNASDARELAMIAQRLRDVLNDPAQPPLADSPIGTSIGIAFFPEDADDSAGVIAAANAAMYAARRAGRHHVAFNALAA
jgi:diguanylate cyclase (GGDEF)-like protein